MIKVKICGLRNGKDAAIAAGLGADAIGVVNVKGSKRFVSLGDAAAIFDSVPVFVSRVIVADPKNIKEAIAMEKTKADCLQLHGKQDPDNVKKIKEKTGLRLIKQVAVSGLGSIAEAQAYADHVDAILLDTKVNGVLGGTGMVHDWTISKRIVESVDVPVILAGGLKPGNVSEAIRKVKPYCVDVASGVESASGLKDKKKIEEFIRRAKTT